MIRTACFAVVAAAMTLTAQSASATASFDGPVNQVLNSRIGQILNGLRNNAHFSARDFDFSLTSGPSLHFTGVTGVRNLNDHDVETLNTWADSLPSGNSPFNGGGYSFTHGAIDNFFGGDNDKKGEDGPTGAAGTGSPEGGAPYEFTHEVLDNYFDDSTLPSGPTPQSFLREGPEQSLASTAAVPEPATWAMMIGGFALAGVALRGRRVALRTA